MEYEIISKYYDKDDKLFHVIYKESDSFRRERITFKKFVKFYEYLEGNLENANLLDYSFKFINLKKYNFDGAFLSSNILTVLDKYDDSLELSIKDSYELVNIKNDFTLPILSDRELEYYEYRDYTKMDVAFLYISDLHINHKLIKKFKGKVNQFEIKKYFIEIITKMKNTMPNQFTSQKIFFVGDVSFDSNMLCIFFSAFREVIPYTSTFFILGNHELWDKDILSRNTTIETIVEEYRLLLCKYNVLLLENELYIPGSPTEKQIYSENDILQISDSDLRKLFINKPYAILGGMGYAGLNDEFNANHGIYRSAPIDRELEKRLSQRFESIHNKLLSVLSDKQIVVISHMPKDDWTQVDYVKDWIYISGHTHRNSYKEVGCRVYSDNQIGYESNSFGFKYASISGTYNIFEDYKDGIYDITRSEYIEFYFGIGGYNTRVTFNREFLRLIMVKRSDTYCFLMLGTNNNLYLLNGGSIKNVNDKSVEYFYENLLNYSSTINTFLQDYTNYQKELSKQIKQFGGSGKIHGSIIDIDYYNHLYINPLDGSVTPYFANSMTDKYVYNNLISLLKYECEELYINYLNNSRNYDENSLIKFDENMIVTHKTKHVESTEMYKVSRVLNGLQYTTNYNVVRVWNDSIALDNTIENGRLLVSGIINPEEMELINREKKEIIKREIKEQREKEKKEKQKNAVKNKKTPEELQFERVKKYIKNISEITNYKIEVINYTNSITNATYKCNDCLFEWNIRSDKFKDRMRYKCPNCKNH